VRPLVRQQNHSPEVWQPSGHPAPSWHVLHGKPAAVQIGPTPTHGLHGPPPQPTHPAMAPIETFVPVRKRPAPSEPAPRNLKNCRLDDFPASLRAAAEVRSIYGARFGIGGWSAGHVQGWSPEWSLGVHGTAMSVKQWHAGSLQLPSGPQLHSEQRKRHPDRLPLLRQQNHSPDVMHPFGHPPPCTQVLQGKPMFAQTGAGEPQGLQGPPPQPTQLVTAPSDTPVRVRNSPAPSEPAPSSLKNCRRDERLASLRAAIEVRSIYARLGIGASPGHVHGWSPECSLGVHGMAVIVKQWHDGFAQPAGQLHSEQRIRQTVPV
jgi:hypothetical protein